jgi:hypothetical protein
MKTVYFYRVSPLTDIGRVTIDAAGKPHAAGVGHVYLNQWRKDGGDVLDFVDYYSSWSNGKVRSSTTKAELQNDAPAE